MPHGWYAVFTRHQHEKSAAQVLLRKGFEVLLPVYRSENRWTDRTKAVLLPLFPNYLFVQADLQRRSEVLRSPGVCWFVESAGIPSLIFPEELETIRKLSESPGAYHPHPYLECGDQVRVLRGPFAGLRGVLTRVKNGHRVVVSVELLRKSAAVEIELSSIERILPPPQSAHAYAQLHEA
jgi:transcription antitermination factor NusG